MMDLQRIAASMQDQRRRRRSDRHRDTKVVDKGKLIVHHTAGIGIIAMRIFIGSLPTRASAEMRLF